MNSAINIDPITVSGGSVSVELDDKGAAVSHIMAFHEWWPSIGISLSEILRAEILSYKISRHLTMRNILFQIPTKKS